MAIKFRSPFVRSVEPSEKDYAEEKMKERWADIGFGDSDFINVNSSTAMRFSAVWFCVRLLSELPASLEANIYTWNKKGYWEVDKDHDLNMLFMRPNTLMDAFTCDEVQNQSLQINGNSLAINYTDSRGRITESIPVPWKFVDVRISDRKLFYVVNYPKLNIADTFPAEMCTHYKILSPDGLIGRGVIKHAEDNIALGMEAEAFGRQFFKKGGHVKGVIESEGEFKSDEAYRSWLLSFKKRFATVKNNFDVPLLERGMKYKELNMPLEQAQFLQTRQFQLTDICRWFMVPPALAGDLTKSSYSSLEQQDLHFVKYNLRNLIKMKEMELNRKVIPSKELGKTAIRFNLDSILRGDTNTRTQHYHTMVTDGVYSRNEVRIMEGKVPKEGLDEILVPANIVGKQAELTNNNSK